MVQNHTRFQGPTFLNGRIFKEAATTTTAGKQSDAKGVGTRFEMREVLFERVHSEKREKKKKPLRSEGGFEISYRCVHPV